MTDGPAAEVADQLGLPVGWLNDAVKGFLVVAEQVFGDRLDGAARFFVEELFAPE